MDAAYSQKVGDEGVEPIGFVADGLRELDDVVGGPGNVGGGEAIGGRLDDGERGAQVVGDGGKQGVAQLIGFGEVLGGGGLGFELALMLRSAELGREDGQQFAVGSVKIGSGQDEHGAVCQFQGERRLVRPVRRRSSS